MAEVMAVRNYFPANGVSKGALRYSEFETEEWYIPIGLPEMFYDFFFFLFTILSFCHEFSF
jgi:hypothetical protein